MERESGSTRAASQPVGFESAVSKRDATVLREHDLLLELHALSPAFRADIAFDAYRHADLEQAVVTRAFPVDQVRNRRILIDHPDTVGKAAIAVLHILVWNPPCPLRELTERHS